RAIIEDIADGARHNRADAVGTHDETATMLHRLTARRRDHADAVGIALDGTNRVLGRKVSAMLLRVREKDVIEAAPIEQDREIREECVGWKTARQQLFAVDIEIELLD